MGILSDYFVASADELSRVSSSGPPASCPRLDAKGFGVIPLEALAKRLGAEALEPGEPVVHGGSYEWFAQKLKPSFVEALGRLSAAQIGEHVVALAGRKEVRRSAEDLASLLADLVALAKRAGEKGVYLWTST